MTGYGKGEYSNDSYRIRVELRAVNHRYADITVKMPRHISYLEEKLKKMIKEKMNRGKIDVYVNLDYINETAIDIKVDLPLARNYKNVLEVLANDLGIDNNIRIHNIIGLTDIIRTERKEVDEDTMWDCLKNAAELSLEEASAMKNAEGLSLGKDIRSRLDLMVEIVKEIQEKSDNIAFEYRDKLRERVNSLLDPDSSINEERLELEIAILADKTDINEEITRFYSHIDQFHTILEENEPVGRKLDFLIQEMNREVNTMGSKTTDLEVTRNVVNIKSEIEKIREQVQNIE